MTKKKKVSRGNPAVSSVSKATKGRGGWKPSTSTGGAISSSVHPLRRRKPDWKKMLVILGVIILAGVFVLTTVLSTVPLLPEAPAPYIAPDVAQGQ